SGAAAGPAPGPAGAALAPRPPVAVPAPAAVEPWTPAGPWAVAPSGPAARPAEAGDEPLATVIAAEAPTRYHADEPLTTARPRRRRWRAYLVLGVALAAAAAGAWVAYATWLAPGATVPGVAGKSRADAAAAVRDEGLRPVFHYVWADKYAAGQVARQSPRGGVKVDDGVKVDLWVSRGPLHIPAPDLSGQTATAAKGALEDAALTYKSHRSASQTAPKGQVFRQKPAAGETVQRGDTVSFWVSSGPPKVDVPDVVGLSQGDAKAALENQGFVPTVDYVAGWGSMPGDVVGQDPAAGTQGRAGDEVVIQVAIF
ncbi:MAG TPA: PASTA domain-containing protein, partial [Thermoleophilia bacterium]|nr:PASTA domain-containing protein [Thermoleophilia bacterium]